MDIKIHHDEQKELFYFTENGKQGELKYYLKDKVMDMAHTGVPVDLQGRGYGTELIEAALEFAKAKGYKVIPSCPFVEAYFDEHESARPLLADG
jgi:uncharacterized protein